MNFLILSALWLLNARAEGIDLNPHVNYGAAPPADKRLEKEIVTRERFVYIGGVKYKQIEYNGEVFTVDARQAETYVDCQRTDMPKDTFAADASFKMTKHTGLFLESLRQHCDSRSNSIVTSPDIRDSNLGVKFKGDGPGAPERKVYINPLNKMGGVGTTF